MNDAMQSYREVGPRAEFEREIGAYMLAVSLFESMLLIMFPAIKDPLSSGNASPTFSAKSLKEKVSALNEVLPRDWRFKDVLINNMIEAANLRNRFAHDFIAMSGFYEGKAVGWHLSNGLSPIQYMELDLHDMRQRRLTVAALTTAVSRLTSAPFTTVELVDGRLVNRVDRAAWNENDLAAKVIATPGSWRDEDEREAFVDIVRKLFPV